MSSFIWALVLFTKPSRHHRRLPRGRAEHCLLWWRHLGGLPSQQWSRAGLRSGISFAQDFLLDVTPIYIRTRADVKALANEDTLLRTHCCRHKCFPVCPRAQHLLRTQILCPGHKNVSDFVQKHFVSATNVPQFAQRKKHHGQQCVRNNVSSFTRALTLPGFVPSQDPWGAHTRAAVCGWCCTGISQRDRPSMLGW